MLLENTIPIDEICLKIKNMLTQCRQLQIVFAWSLDLIQLGQNNDETALKKQDELCIIFVPRGKRRISYFTDFQDFLGIFKDFRDFQGFQRFYGIFQGFRDFMGFSKDFRYFMRFRDFAWM